MKYTPIIMSREASQSLVHFTATDTYTTNLRNTFLQRYWTPYHSSFRFYCIKTAVTDKNLFYNKSITFLLEVKDSILPLQNFLNGQYQKKTSTLSKNHGSFRLTTPTAVGNFLWRQWKSNHYFWKKSNKCPNNLHYTTIHLQNRVNYAENIKLY